MKNLMTLKTFSVVSIVCASAIVCPSVANGEPSWTSAEQIPGLAALNEGHVASVDAISCSSSGNCSIGGNYVDGSNVFQAFLASETNGVWGNAIEVPGLSSLNLGQRAIVYTISCSSNGNCAAAGSYSEAKKPNEASFVVDEVNGVWGTAVPITTPPSTSTNSFSSIRFISCPSDGNCSAVGEFSYTSRNSNWDQSFVVDETDGVWKSAVQVPGLQSLAKYGGVELSSIDCGAPGSCSTGGTYSLRTTHGLHSYPWVANEVDGVWGVAISVSGASELFAGSDGTTMSAISCSRPGYCTAIGYYAVGSQNAVFAINESEGRWGSVSKIALPAQIDALSCGAPGNCVATGWRYVVQTPVLLDEVGGHWQTAKSVAGLAQLPRYWVGQPDNANGSGGRSISCNAPGDCTVVGDYVQVIRQGTALSRITSAFEVSESSGVWGRALEVPGLARINLGTQNFNGVEDVEVSCSAPGVCGVGGDYTSALFNHNNQYSGDQEGFIASSR